MNHDKKQPSKRLQKAQALIEAYAAMLRIVGEQFCEHQACETCQSLLKCEEAETALYAAREAMEAIS